jgi:exodeoxyribonuclease-3
MERLRSSLGFIDPIRETTPEPRKLFSWWSYRAADFRTSNRGLRLDHLWITPGLGKAAGSRAAAGRIHDEARAWERPSDHAPISIDLEV